MKVFVNHKTALAFDDEDKSLRMIGASSNMKNDYEKYEKACEQIRQDNTLLLDAFVAMLQGQRLAPRTIGKHRDNVDFFINEFLFYEGPKQPAEGIGEVSEFLGDWFIRKAMWSTPEISRPTPQASISSTAFWRRLTR